LSAPESLNQELERLVRREQAEKRLPSIAAAVVGGTSILGGRGGFAGTILGALILTLLVSLLTVLNIPEAMRQVLFGAIIVAVAAAYTRVTSEA
jgi:ribose transport system permease protein